MSEIIPRQRADRRHLQQIIAGLTEGIILLDPDQTIVWANDAALAMHGVASRADLGADVSEYHQRFELRYRNHHRVEPGSYPMDRVVAGEEFDRVTVEVARVGDAEMSWVHEIRSLLLSDTAGDPDCLVLVINDATERVSAEERFERTFAANPAPAVICRLADLRYVKVNPGFLEMTGYTSQAILGRSVYELDILQHAEQRDLAIECLNAGRTIPQMEATLRLPDGTSKLVIVAGQPIEIGDEPCMLFTFIDLELRKRAEDALRHSEERFAKAFKLSPLPSMVTALRDLRIEDVNEAFLAVTGYSRQEVIGHTGAAFGLWGNNGERHRLEHKLEKGQSIRDCELQMRTKSGELIDFLMTADTVTIRDEKCVLSVFQDITERKRSEAELIAAIEAVMQDTSWFSRTVIEKLATVRRPRGSAESSAELADLTVRERGILGLMGQGLDDAAIAARLGISRNTVRNHVVGIYRKIDVHNRSAAIVWARDRGFTGDGPNRADATRRRPHARRT
jgi:PAS domain S-box-containing protein